MSDHINIDKLSDTDLVKLVLKDQENFSYLIKRYQSKLLRYIRRISGLNIEDAEDVLQDVFIKVYQNLNSFDTSLKFSSWIYRITHNQVISNFRKKQARPQEISGDNELILNNIVSDLDMGRDIDLGYARENIDKILNSLDIKYREVLVLKFLEEKEYKEISDILKKPMGTVATLLNRAKKQFREKLVQSDIKL